MRSIALIGFMGCGKTTVGRLLARGLQRSFADTDDKIVELVGLAIPEIFTQKGEDFFRSLETLALRELVCEGNSVLSCGGGIVKSPDNVAILKSKGWVVYLNTSPMELARRIAAEPGTRPLIYGGRAAMPHEEVLARVEELLDERRELYEHAADQKVDTTGRAPEDIVREILNHLPSKVACGA